MEIDFFNKQPMFVLDHLTLDILDANQHAIKKYGYSYEELMTMNIGDFGKMELRRELIDTLKDNISSDKVWHHTSKKGDTFYVQFTSHLFNNRGKPSRLAVAHDVTTLIEEGGENKTLLPQPQNRISNSPLASIELNHDLKIISWSDKAKELFGWTKDEVLGDPDFFEKFVHRDELEDALQRIKELNDSKKKGFTVEGRNYTKDGRVIDCEWHNSVLYDKEGNLVSVYSQVHDISERKESENLFKALSEEALVGVYLIQDDVFKYINPHFAKIFKYDREEIQNRLGPLDLTHPDDRETVRTNIEKRLQGEENAIQYAFRCCTKDDETIHVNVYGSGINYKGKPAVVGTLVDITESKQAFEQYRSSVESFEDLFDSINDAIYIQNESGEFIQVNQGAVEMYGYERDELIGRSPEFLAAPGKVDLNKTQKFIKKALNGEPQQFMWWGKRKNGEVFPKEVSMNPGNYFGKDVVIAIGRDVSEQYEAREKVRKNEELFRQLFQNSHIGIVMMDEHQEIRFVNEAFEEIFGYSSEEIEGLDIDKLIVPEDRLNEAKNLSKTIFRGESSNITAKRKKKDGRLVDVLVYGVPVIVDGKTIAIFGMYVDITDRKRAEEQIKRSLKEKEVLLAEIHHRVKNNLAVITGLLELQRYNTSQEEAQQALYESQMRINSIALIHEKLYQSEDLAQISFATYIDELAGVILESLAGDKSIIDLKIEADDVELTINEAIPCGLIINEVITNAFKHAFERTQDGEISIRLCNRDQILSLVIEDNGCGLPEELDLNDQSSLGMTLISTLTSQLNGESSFEDTGNGTRFKLTFEYD